MSLNSIVVALLASPFRWFIGRSVTALRITGRRTGRRFVLPVQYAREGDTIIAYPGGYARKTWWRNLSVGSEVGILLDGVWRAATAVALDPRSSGYVDAVASYRRRWRTLQIDCAAPIVRIDLGESWA